MIFGATADTDPPTSFATTRERWVAQTTNAVLANLEVKLAMIAADRAAGTRSRTEALTASLTAIEIAEHSIATVAGVGA